MNEQLPVSLKLQKYLALIPFFGVVVVILCGVSNIKKAKDMPKSIVYFLICLAPMFALFLVCGLLMLLINGQNLSVTLMIIVDLIVIFAIMLGCAYSCYAIEIATLKKLSNEN